MGILHSLIEKVDPSDTNLRTPYQATSPDSERTIDPLIAVRLHNKKHSRILQLPEEVLLQIVSHCCSDDSIVTLYCLRRVSQTFRCLIYEPSIWKYTSTPPPADNDMYETEYFWNLPTEQWKQLKQHLLRDGLCTECKLIRLGHYIPGCKFYSETSRSLYCQKCDSLHDTHEFSLSSTDTERGRQCLGRQGGVQLCEHVHIYWADIENHITYWKEAKSRGYWRHCLDSFNIECRDPSHKTHCSAGLPTTGPRARLASTWEGVVLDLEWKAHSGLMTLAITPDGHARLPAPELRALFERYRAGTGGILFPSYPCANSLPEMTCFSRPGCVCVHYEDISAPPPRYDYSGGAFLTPFVDSGGWTGCRASHDYQNDSVLSHSRHWEVDGPVCVLTTYSCTIRICCKKDTKVNPSHEWLHAMDPDTYDTPHAGDQRFLCKNRDCMAYYRRPGVHTCSNPDHNIHVPCSLCRGSRG